MKKLITFALVLVMLASIALPAMASEIQPRYPSGYCSKCGQEAEYRGVNVYTDEYQYYCNNCHRWFYLPVQ